MRLQVEPERLVVLSLQTTTKFLIDTVAELCKQSKLQDSKKLSIFRHTQKGILCKNIPTTVANALSYKYLQELDLRKDLVEFTDVLKEIIHIFQPPEISELRIDWHWFYIGDIFLKGNTCLQGIKIFKLSRRSRQYEPHSCYTPDINTLLFQSITDLRELTLHDICSDKILSIVFETCKSLQTLDVTGSRDVTDVVVESIIELESLEKLFIKYTSITIEGTEAILRGLLKHRKYELNSFSCKCLNQEILLMLAQLPNVRSLSTSPEFKGDIDLSLSSNSFYNLRNLNSDLHEKTISNGRSLQYVQSLEIDQRKRRSFLYPKLHVKYFGTSLLSLELEAKEVDVSHLVRSCPLLLTLHLRTNNLTEMFDPTVSQFPSLRNLTLVMSRGGSPTPLLSLCSNLTFLELCANLDEYTDIKGALFQTSMLKDLEILFIASNSENIPVEVVRNFESHCAKLQTVKVFGENYLELTETFSSCYGVEVSRELCLKVADELTRTRRMFSPGRCGTTLTGERLSSWGTVDIDGHFLTYNFSTHPSNWISFPEWPPSESNLRAALDALNKTGLRFEEFESNC
ncbi:uncharacterized protein [Periplaneta americana]|uniref:uncharacterized protein isoform X2 n=1 Tax=Periplaneta americana TaxID=6978 RepID=UPI0037E72773